MNQAEVLNDVEALTRAKEIERDRQGGSINPEILAMHEILPSLEPRLEDFLKRRLAFSIVHFREPRVRTADFKVWQEIKGDVQEYLIEVPQNLKPLPRGWSKVFSDVLLLYGDPHGE